MQYPDWLGFATGVTSEVISIDEMVEPNGNSAVRSFDINIRKPPITPATPKSGSVTPKSAPATPKSVSLTPRSVASSVGTTSSRLCHYLEDCLGHIAHATEQLEVGDFAMTVFLGLTGQDPS